MMKRFASKALAGTLSLAMILGLGVTATSNTASAAKVKVKKITVTSPSGKTAYVAKGKKISLTATVKVSPNKKANKKVTYKSANSKVASVNKKGQVKGVSVGKTKITVTSAKNKAKKATIKVVVQKTAAKKVKLSASKLTLAVGGKKKLKASVTPKNASKKIEWTSSKKKVATVSSSGLVKGKKTGTAVITAKAADGSGKKATCKVTVGASIKSVEVMSSGVLRVTLTSKKTLKAANFTIQNKKTEKGSYKTSEGVEKVTTSNKKVYDVVLDDVSSIMSYSWLKVKVKGMTAYETYVGNVPSLSYAVNDTISRIDDYVVDDTYSESWSLSGGIDTTGVVTYSVSGLPAGLKAYFNKNKTRVSVVGKFTQPLDGATAVLTGTDEKGKTFKRSFVFYVGDKNTIVGNFLDRTVLTYMQDNPTTPNIDERSGFNFDEENILEIGDAVISGGSGSYRYEITGLPANVEQEQYTPDVESGDISAPGSAYGTANLIHKTEQGTYKYLPTAAGTYPVTVTIVDRNNEAVRKAFAFNLTLTEGVMLSGTVKDASGAPAQDIRVFGSTKADAYGNYETFVSETEKDGTYMVRTVPGLYETYVSYDNWAYDYSIETNFAAPTAKKDFTLPLYRVAFTAVPGAAAYSFYNSPVVVDAYGYAHNLRIDNSDSRNRTYAMYAYLPAGTYEFSPAADKDDDTVYAYTKVSQENGIDSNGAPYVAYYLADADRLPGVYKLSGTFTVAGAGNVALTAALATVTE